MHLAPWATAFARERTGSSRAGKDRIDRDDEQQFHQREGSSWAATLSQWRRERLGQGVFRHNERLR